VDRRQRALILRDLVLQDLRRRWRRLRAAWACCQECNSRRCGDQERTRCGNTVASATAADDRQHATPQRRNRNPSPRFWLLRALPFAPGSNRVTAGLLRLRRDTPPNAFARDSFLVADVLARGSLPSATFPGFQDPSGHAGRRLAAHSCGGSRGMACPQHAHRVPF
jgi:hypothetical protein